jgi:chromosome segregation ATPase
LEQRDTQIGELEKKSRSNFGKNNEDYSNLETDHAELLEKFDIVDGENNALKGKLEDYALQIEKLTKQKIDSDNKLKESNLKIDALKKDIQNLDNKQKNAERQSLEFGKLKTDKLEAARKIQIENEDLKAEVT